MAEAALKERLPPLRKDTLDWRDMMVPGGARTLGAGGGEVLGLETEGICASKLEMTSQLSTTYTETSDQFQGQGMKGTEWNQLY